MKPLFKSKEGTIILDFSNVVFRASAVGGDYYVSRFCDMMINYRKRFAFHKFVFAIEGRGTEQKRRIFSGYKAGRSYDPNVVECRKACLSLLKCTKCHIVKAPKGEADDAISCYLAIEQPKSAVIVSEDKDLWQLIKPGKYSVLSKRRGTVTPETVKSVMGIPPSKVPLHKAVFGDSSDGIPRVPRVPSKQLLKLVQDSSSVKELLDKATELKETSRERVLGCKTQIEMSFRLATLCSDLSLIHREFEPSRKKLEARLKRHEVVLPKRDLETFMRGARL